MKPQLYDFTKFFKFACVVNLLLHSFSESFCLSGLRDLLFLMALAIAPCTLLLFTSECSMEIRKETAADFEAIMNVTLAAAKLHQVGKLGGYHTLNEMRKSGMLALSLVAEIDRTVVGHAAFFPLHVAAGDKGWYALGPISVLPECQSQGIRKALIAEGLEILRAMHGRGVAIVGDPDYFKPLGFLNAPQLAARQADADGIMVMPFDNRMPHGRFEFPDVFMSVQ